MSKLTPFLWFNDNAEEAIHFYLSVFPGSRIISEQRKGKDGPLFTATIELAGQRLHLLNGGPHYALTEAFSLFVDCEDQAEVDMLWEKLSAGGEIQMCGWLKDRFGLSWQVIPKALMRLMRDPDPVKAQRVMQAMLGMKKIDVAQLEAAHKGE